MKTKVVDKRQQKIGGLKPGGFNSVHSNLSDTKFTEILA